MKWRVLKCFVVLRHSLLQRNCSLNQLFVRRSKGRCVAKYLGGIKDSLLLNTETALAAQLRNKQKKYFIYILSTVFLNEGKNNLLLLVV